MNAREDLARLFDAPGGTRTYGIEDITAGPIDTSQAKDVDGRAVAPLELEPPCLRVDPTTATLASRQQLRGLIHPAARPVAIDARGREIADPPEPPGGGDVFAMEV